MRWLAIRLLISLLLIAFLLAALPPAPTSGEAPVRRISAGYVRPSSAVASRSDSRIQNWQTFEVTAYTLRQKECGKPPGHKDYGRTASGKMAVVGVTVAAGPEVPLGAKIYIPELAWYNGTGVFVVHDRGPAVVAGCVDVYFGDPELDPGCVRRALDFGRRNMKGTVVR